MQLTDLLTTSQSTAVFSNKILQQFHLCPKVSPRPLGIRHHGKFSFKPMKAAPLLQHDASCVMEAHKLGSSHWICYKFVYHTHQIYSIDLIFFYSNQRPLLTVRTGSNVNTTRVSTQCYPSHITPVGAITCQISVCVFSHVHSSKVAMSLSPQFQSRLKYLNIYSPISLNGILINTELVSNQWFYHQAKCLSM